LLVVYIQKQVIECIAIFADNMHHLAFNVIPNAAPNSAFPTAEPNLDLDTGLEFDSIPNVCCALWLPNAFSSYYQAAKLLLVLNNCRYTREVVIPGIASRFEAIFKRRLLTNAQVRPENARPTATSDCCVGGVVPIREIRGHDYPQIHLQ